MFIKTYFIDPDFREDRPVPFFLSHQIQSNDEFFIPINVEENNNYRVYCMNITSMHEIPVFLQEFDTINDALKYCKRQFRLYNYNKRTDLPIDGHGYGEYPYLAIFNINHKPQSYSMECFYKWKK